MMLQHDRERGHSFSSVRGFAAHTHWDQLGLPVNEWLRRTLINEKRHHTGVGNPLQSRLPCRRALWTQVDLKLPFTTIVANGRDGWRPCEKTIAGNHWAIYCRCAGLWHCEHFGCTIL